MSPLDRREPAPASVWDHLFRRLRDLAGRSETGGLRAALEELIEESEEDQPGQFTAEQRALLLNALAFGELRADDVMVPRTEIAAVSVEAGLDRVVETMRGVGHSRLVVYRETLDDVLGIVHVKDLLAFWGDGLEFKLDAIIRPVLVVPPSMRIIDLLLEMRDAGMHLAIVVDEFGGTDGLVAIGDIVEELVGELQNRPLNGDSTHLLRLANGTAEADARITLDDLERDLGFAFLSQDERAEADTLAGLIVSQLDRVPEPGEQVDHGSGLRFEILESDPRRVKRVRITGLPSAPEPGGEGDMAGLV